jgi:hypothetical protein
MELKSLFKIDSEIWVVVIWWNWFTSSL